MSPSSRRSRRAWPLTGGRTPSPASARWPPLLAGLLAGLLIVAALVAGAPLAHAGSAPPGGSDPWISAVLIRNGSTVDFHADDRALITIPNWPDFAGPKAIALVSWREPDPASRQHAMLPIPLGYTVASWQVPTTLTLSITLPGGIAPGLYSIKVQGATTTAQTQIFYLSPDSDTSNTSAPRPAASSRPVVWLTPEQRADAGAVGLLAALAAGIFLLGALSLQVEGYQRRRATAAGSAGSAGSADARRAGGTLVAAWRLAWVARRRRWRPPRSISGYLNRAARKEPPMSFKLYSDVFPAEQPIPVRFTCDGQNLSPKLSWHDTPAGTQSLALIVDDPDAPKGTFTHWLVYNIPPQLHDLIEGTPGTDYLPRGALQGRNSFGDMSYGGPCPPPGSAPHRYQFTLYALDMVLRLGAGATVEALRDAMRGHIIGETRMRGTYQRAAGSPTMAAGGAAGRP